MNSTRIENEIKHGQKIKQSAEDIWGWGSDAGKIRAERRANFFIERSKMTQEQLVLEIGCGTGLFTEKISKTGAKIIATDISDDLLSIARKKNIPNTTFQLADAHKLNFSDNFFDVVFGSSILHHLEMEKSLKEIYRVLKPGGKIVFAEPNMLNPQILIQKNIPFIKRWLGDSPDETAIVRWSFSKLLKKLNYRDVEIFPYDFLHPFTPKLMINFINGIGKTIEKVPVLKEIAGSVIIYAKKQNS